MSPVRQQELRDHCVLHGVSWHTYMALLKDLEDRPGLRVTYDRGTLEIMSPSERHENLKSLLGRMVELLTLELNIVCRTAGSTTWKRQDLERGLEPDECYYIANEPRVRGKREADLSVDPPPDLAIEVDLSRSAIDKLEVYAALGVPEVWRYDGQRLRAYLLENDARYAEGVRSASFPFLSIDHLERFLANEQRLDETRLMRTFRDWVRLEFSQHARP